MNVSKLILQAPVSGVVAPLDSVGYPAFSHGLYGQGAAMDPTSTSVLAPASGTICDVDARDFTITLLTASGVKLRMALGVGHSVAAQDLGISAFSELKPGLVVGAGEHLFNFDTNHLAPEVESLFLTLSIIGLPAGQVIRNLTCASGHLTAGSSALLTLELEPDVPSSDRLDIIAPLSGVLFPLESVPDPVFAGRMVGDGVSIDPTDSEVLAPADGIITQLHSARHALTITTPAGVEVLLHVGIDTVRLKGAGFEALVREGETVKTGQPLLRFDADAVARGSTSLLTQVLVVNLECVRGIRPRQGALAAGKDVAFTVFLKTTTSSASAPPVDSGVLRAVTSDPILLPNPLGLHARPAAALAAAAKTFASELKLTRQADGERAAATANARSVVAIMGLATRRGDTLTLEARGPDAERAIEILATLLSNGSGEDISASESPPIAALRPPQTPLPSPQSARAEDGLLQGICASPGLVVGKIFHLRRAVIAITERSENPDTENAALDQALSTVGANLAAQAANDNNHARRQILKAHQELLDDPELKDVALAGIKQGQTAAFAWRTAVQQQSAVLERLDNALLRERATDLRDVGRQVLALLAGVEEVAGDVPFGSILIAEELTPSDTARFKPGSVVGFCTTSGGATSHVAILARSLGLPAICGISPTALGLADGSTAILDASAATLNPSPDEATLAEAAARRAEWEARNALNLAGAHQPAVTRDGTRIEVAANVTNGPETEAGLAQGADGVGLLRSEFLFDHRESAPGEEEQVAAYAMVARALGTERALVVRTLDVGGDKPLAYLPLPKEENPFLGMRGLRVSLDRPEILRPQLRAILRVASLTKLHIMFPMVTSLDEFLAARAILEEERRALGAPLVQVGVMIEVPAAALLAGQLAREADFFSIGTNDLTQYVLAMDRGHPRLAKQADALHPAVLTAIKLTCDGAHAHGRWVGVCGGLAGDELAVPALIGLGVDELSVPVPAVPAIKAAVSRCDRHRCIALTRELLALSSPAEVRARLTAFAEIS